MNQIWEKLNQQEKFQHRHIGPSAQEIEEMLKFLGYASLDDLVDKAVPANIKDHSPADIPPALTEHDALTQLRKKLNKNRVFKSFIGAGYHPSLTPSVIQRNILENPGWYTQYTPYQPEISQGRLEALFNFQTVIKDLTALDIANASLLDEATSAVEAMNMCFFSRKPHLSNKFLVSDVCHPQTITVLKTRAEPLAIDIVVENHENFSFAAKPFGLLLQYPATDGSLQDYRSLVAKAHANDCLVTVAADLMSLVLLTPPGEFGADIAVGSSQRFGLPLGFGGPHAGYLATKEQFIRKMPGRLVGLSKDASGNPAYRLTLATREQHIRREKATSNICTAQVLLAIMSSMYAVYHGPEGLKNIANRIHAHAALLHNCLKTLGLEMVSNDIFDTVKIRLEKQDISRYRYRALTHEANLRYLDDNHIVVSLDETTSLADIATLVAIFNDRNQPLDLAKIAKESTIKIPQALRRTSSFLQYPVFNKYHSETEMQRYIKKLESRDLSLTRSMIPLGSCTMKLNAASELFPVSWPEISQMHPFAPLDQALGCLELFQELECYLAQLTGFSAVSLQPNSGAQGELTGLLVIRKHFQQKGESNRNICLIPSSAHGTNPASAAFAGMKTVEVNCDAKGNIDLADLRIKAEKHRKDLAAIMVTYPSTHGVFEEGIVEICRIVHDMGGQVYMDGANLQAQLGVCYAGKFGPDVCHMNLHKTFAIPHGGGGPGVGAIAVKEHLAAFLPKTPLLNNSTGQSIGSVAAAPWGSASVLPISWMYIRMMGHDGLAQATKVSILNANYIRKRLDEAYPTVYMGKENLVAHECILDIRQIKKATHIDETDIAKRLMDYGFHAPTISWPVVGTMMVEPTESEAKFELDRFCDAMLAIRKEIKEVEEGRASQENNLLKNAPHTQALLLEPWQKPYSIQAAFFPDKYTLENKFWTYSSRIDNAYGDSNLVCSCM